MKDMNPKSKNYLLSEINYYALNNVSELVDYAESKYHAQMKKIVNKIISMPFGHKIVLFSGPSSGGKTTTANILRKQLKERGMNTHVISLDDFYNNKDKIPLGSDGKPDIESVNALNIPLIHKCLLELIEKGETDLPIFDFKSSCALEEKRKTVISDNDVVIVEGIHALNPIIRDTLPVEKVLTLYISVKANVEFANGKIIRAQDIRFLRRMLRDYRFRGASPEETFEMWGDVCIGEKNNIQPYKKGADFIINSMHCYEASVYKNSIVPLLWQIEEKSEYYKKAQSLIEQLGPFVPISESAVPENSLIQEFINGGI